MRLTSARSDLRVGRTDLQDDLADVRTGFHTPVSFRSQCKWEGHVDGGSHLSALDQRPDYLEQRPGN